MIVATLTNNISKIPGIALYVPCFNVSAVLTFLPHTNCMGQKVSIIYYNIIDITLCQISL